jgi:hypothetical protein
MMKRLRIYVVCGVVACTFGLLLGADTCQAQAWNPSPLNYWYSYHPGPYGPRLYNAQRGIPHFAAFPPVYYSHIVPRPYGYSPYAYVPGVVTPSFELCQPRHQCASAMGQRRVRSARPVPAPEPVSIRNPYFPSGPDEDATVERLSGGPLRIQNPYFKAEAPPLAGG